MTAASGSSSPTATSPSRLPELIALAQEPSSEKRRELLRQLTDQFFGTTEIGPTESRLYGSVLADLSAEMETAVRVELATRFSAAETAPTRLIRHLAADEAAVAAPVLRASPVLTDDDLLAVARTRGQDHLRAVSDRARVSEALADVIVARGDDETLGVLLRNDGASLSRAASEIAVDRARANPALHEAAVQRNSLPSDLLNEMYFVVESRLRRQILERNARLNPSMLESALAAGRARVAAEDGTLPEDHAEARAYIEELRAAGQLTPPTLARLLRAPSRTPFLIALAQLCDLDFHTCRQIIDRRELDALAVVCKAAELDRALFLTCAVAVLNTDGDAMAKAHSYARMYVELTPDAAQRTLRFWRLRRVGQAA